MKRQQYHMRIIAHQDVLWAIDLLKECVASNTYARHSYFKKLFFRTQDSHWKKKLVFLFFCLLKLFLN